MLCVLMTHYADLLLFFSVSEASECCSDELGWSDACRLFLSALFLPSVKATTTRPVNLLAADYCRLCTAAERSEFDPVRRLKLSYIADLEVSVQLKLYISYNKDIKLN
jgi:hypothetical protein